MANTFVPAQQGPASAGAAGQAGGGVVPFYMAAKHGREQAYVAAAVQPGASQTIQTPVPLPATGYLRRVHMEVTTSTSGSAGTGAGDFPFNIFAYVQLSDTNGTPIVGLSGYNLLLADTYGAYAGAPDPRVDPDYSSSVAKPNIQPYLPIEIDVSGMGSLQNLSNASAYRVSWTIDTAANILTGGTAPTLAVTLYTDYWTLPNTVDMDGRQQATAPPYAGTAQLWSQQNGLTVNSGAQRVPLTRMGNLLRTVLCVFRSSSTRSDTVPGDPIVLRWDDLNLLTTDRQTIRKVMREYSNDLTARDVGVYLIGEYNRGVSRFMGGIGAASWLPTVTATRYEVQLSNATSGTIDFVINDVSVSPLSPEVRASMGGLMYHPPVAPTVPGAL